MNQIYLFGYREGEAKCGLISTVALVGLFTGQGSRGDDICIV